MAWRAAKGKRNGIRCELQTKQAATFTAQTDSISAAQTSADGKKKCVKDNPQVKSIENLLPESDETSHKLTKI